MRIEAYNQIQQVYNSSKVQKAARTEKTGRTDAVQISSVGKDIQTVKQALAETPDIRGNVVAPLKQAEDATLIDSSEMGIDDVVKTIIALTK